MLPYNLCKVTLSLCYFAKIIKIPICKAFIICYPYSKYQNKNNKGFHKSVGISQRKKIDDQTLGYNKINLQSYLNQYLSKLQKGSYKLLDYVKICRQIANYYTKERHKQYIRHRIQLQKMIDTLSSLETGQPCLQEYFDLMDFLKIIELIEPINKMYTNTLKDILFSIMRTNHLQKLQEIKLQDLLILYCKISVLNSPQTQKVGKFLMDQMQKKCLNKERIADTSNVQMVLRSLSQRKFWYDFDSSIFRILLLDLKGNLKQDDKFVIIKIAESLDSYNVRSHISDYESILVIKQIINRAVQIMQQGYKREIAQYFLSKSCRSGSSFQKIYQIIYSNLLSQIADGEKNSKLLKNFCEVLQKIKNKRYGQQDIYTVIYYLRTSFQNEAFKSIVFKQQSIQLIVLQMIRYRFFDTNIAVLNKILNSRQFQIYWSFIVQYSIRNVPFPIQLLSKKIKPKTANFVMDNNYLKAAVSISRQFKLDSANQLLLNSYENIVSSIKSQKWGNQHWIWLLKQSVSNIKQSRLYFQQYSQALMQHVNSSISAETKVKQKENVSVNIVWKYILTVADLSSQNLQLLTKMPLDTIQAVSLRQSFKFNQQIIINRLLLKTVIININNEKINLQNFKMKGFLFVVKLYSESISYETEESVELYFNVATLLVRNFFKMPQQYQKITKTIIRASLNINSSIIQNSSYFKQFLAQIFVKIQYFCNRINQKDFIVFLIRKGLEHNLVTAKQLALVNIEHRYFSQLQISIIKSIKKQHRNQNPY